MSRKTLGLIMIVAGLVIALIGVVGWLFSGDDEAEDPPTTPGATTTTLPISTTAGGVTTTTSASTTTSTTLPTTTTTTIDAGGEIGSFVPTFADAISRQDIDYLMETLHPSVLALFAEDTCRTFISDEILLLEQYRLIGEVDGPTTQLVAGSEVEMYQAPVAFAFQGQEFTSEAAFAFVDGQVRWFTQCGGG